jgi:hypothetical protein
MRKNKTVTSNHVQNSHDGKNKAITSNQGSPGFFSVTPATVRYDSSLPWGAKTLYGEISALTNMTGYCWAGNGYFTSLYKVSDRTISYWIAKLHNAGHITVYYEFFENSKKIKRRLIKLPPPVAAAIEKIPEESLKQPEDAPPGAVNGTASGGAKNCTTQDMEVQEIAGPGSTNTPDNHQNGAASGGAKNCITPNTEVQEIAGPGGAKNCGENNTNSLNNIKAAAAATAFSDHGHPPPGGETAARSLKPALAAIDPVLTFPPWFYEKAARFLESRRLGLSYAGWIFDQSRMRKPGNLRGMFITLFFADDLAELFLATRPDEPGEPPEPLKAVCPICETRYDFTEPECPSCGLISNPSDYQISSHRHLLSLVPERRAEYLSKQARIFEDSLEQGSNFDERMNRITALKEEFGFPE